MKTFKQYIPVLEQQTSIDFLLGKYDEFESFLVVDENITGYDNEDAQKESIKGIKSGMVHPLDKDHVTPDPDHPGKKILHVDPPHLRKKVIHIGVAK